MLSFRRNHKVFSFALLLESIVIFLFSWPGAATEIYDVGRFYFSSFGPLDVANDANFSHIVRLAGNETASGVVFHRIHVTNLVLVFALINTIFLPFYWDYLVGRFFKGVDYRVHVISFFSIFLAGLGVFYLNNLSGDYFFIASASPKFTNFPPSEYWWLWYAIGQAAVIFWSGMTISIVVFLVKLLLGKLEADDVDMAL